MLKEVQVKELYKASSSASTSLEARESSPRQDGAARAAAGQLGIFSPAGVVCSADPNPDPDFDPDPDANPTPNQVCSAEGPAWTRGELEPPQGARRAANSLSIAVYTPEQQKRLGVDEAGEDTRNVRVEASRP